ncbi:hypothetical protein CROQUDRAFT_673879 [Cronartium quercuum f. sp. fusiforme G11]|uniref:Trehalose 6-phosphate phosphatase n=1 Tax=Cronartium quercuum f. sp. fusiforme G11 TaxID=708437 RepID=A0A9P6NCR2_9BASI|nr:hypothetical protein CROQUDRAFT_673879 [Cronartium quercuum f. sp. fusiforme G11]
MEWFEMPDKAQVHPTEILSLGIVKRIGKSANDQVSLPSHRLFLDPPVKVTSRNAYEDFVGQVLSDYKEANENRLIVADYDGTLSHFFDDPDQAIPTKELMTALEKLSSDPRNTVWIISGRDEKFLHNHFSLIENLGLAAEYGVAVREPGKKQWFRSLSVGNDLDEAVSLMKESVKKIKGSAIETKPSSRVWHYRRVYEGNEEACVREAENLELHLNRLITKKNLPYDVVSGNLVVEVKPKNTNKRIALENIYEKSSSHPGFVLIAGDAKPDEEMFEVGSEKRSVAVKNSITPRLYTVKVKNGVDVETRAGYSLEDSTEMVGLLKVLSEHKND